MEIFFEKMIRCAAIACAISAIGSSAIAGNLQFTSYWAPSLPEFADHNGAHTARSSLIGFASIAPNINVFADVGISGTSKHIETTRIGAVFFLDHTKNARIIVERRNIVRVSGRTEQVGMISLQKTF